ncbi:hypothetical protein CPB84DRAFT_1822354 [Gymnopilus junonius]|uniref:Uncharacterized protein n=1 Tax=Gymnopilus junonius TaxID=109634 RepID=A0A9P5NVD1_GYMJU|nr:hypothetical protein CPB84DRAFT_1822354 [Gymnopilus junonius]
MSRRNLRDLLPNPFADCVFFQSSSNELVVYSPTAGQHVVITCLLLGTSVSTQIVEALSGDIFAFCHKFPSACQFSLNLTTLAKTVTLFSSYPNLPTTASSSLPSMGTILADFLLNAAPIQGPYFEGYCGEHRIDYPSVLQLAGVPSEGNCLPGLITLAMFRGHLCTYANPRWSRSHAQLDEDAGDVSKSITAPLRSRAKPRHHKKVVGSVTLPAAAGDAVKPSQVPFNVSTGGGTSQSSNAIAGLSHLSDAGPDSDRLTRERELLARLAGNGIYSSDMHGTLVNHSSVQGLVHQITNLQFREVKERLERIRKFDKVIVATVIHVTASLKIAGIMIQSRKWEDTDGHVDQHDVEAYASTTERG